MMGVAAVLGSSLGYDAAVTYYCRGDTAAYCGVQYQGSEGTEVGTIAGVYLAVADPERVERIYRLHLDDAACATQVYLRWGDEERRLTFDEFEAFIAEPTRQPSVREEVEARRGGSPAGEIEGGSDGD